MIERHKVTEGGERKACATTVHQGTGVSKRAISGKLLAEHIMGEQNPMIDFSLPGRAPAQLSGPAQSMGCDDEQPLATMVGRLTE